MKISSGQGPLGSSISTGEIDNGAVTTAKIANNAVTGAKLDDGIFSFIGFPVSALIKKFAFSAGTDLTANDGTVDTGKQAGDIFSIVQAAGNFKVRTATDANAGARHFRPYWNLGGSAVNATAVYAKFGITMTANVDVFEFILWNAQSPTTVNSRVILRIDITTSAADLTIVKVSSGGAETVLATESIDITATNYQWFEFVWVANQGMWMNRIGNPAGTTYPRLFTSDSGETAINSFGIDCSHNTPSSTEDIQINMPFLVMYS